ncbi:MAG: ATP-dependent DNA helicase RecG [Candidatus Saccharibacteria bacterium]|nr:ATP-dependent DNA helicase RecG [Candidatus Saccharibacteria bacterium]
MNFFDTLDSLDGVGPKTAESLKKCGIFTIKDLLYYFPRSYEDYKANVPLRDIEPGKLMVKAKIKNLKTRYVRRNFNITEGEIYDDTGACKVVWFNQPYRAKSFNENKEYYFTGNFDFKYGRYQLTSPTTIATEDIANVESNGFQPIYRAFGSHDSKWFKKLFEKARNVAALAPDMLPDIPSGTRADALYNIHFPNDRKDVDSARDYLAYEEIFELVLAAKLNKNENLKLKSDSLKFNLDSTNKFLKSLPFELTQAQKKAAWSIMKDLEKTSPMNRLLQGDVGSGKTVVAAASAFQAIENGAQVALLAPTAILATQHYEGLKKLLEPLGVKVALLISATKNKTELKKQIEQGKIDFVIGTHAILTDDTIFQNLGLAIIDEQHRFGVMQRQKLLAKTLPKSPHLLSMTATPIPRSLQLTVFGDLDVSIINEFPKGRQKIETHIMKEINMKENLYPEISAHIKDKEQIYWICSLIEETGRSEATDVKKQTEKLKKIFPKATIDFLHGRMKPDEKDAVMEKFAKGKTDILVSTTVVEVGVDVPNATQMVIMDAENFGLAQLHQLRGRVGRGDKKSSCYLVVKGDTEPSRRLEELEKSSDGFHLAEVDLQLRGPGEIYGHMQHGELNLKIASLADTRLIAKAQKHAETIAKNPQILDNYTELKNDIAKYQQLTTLN